MCGIFGILGSGLERDVVREQLLSGVAQLDHRGPDGWGYYQSSTVALGHSRLAIFDVAEGHQPMSTSNSVIVYNGEVYNHYELRAELESQGVIFEGHCDTEVIQRLYERYGLDCLSMLNGQFAFLLWDKKKQQLIVARDRLGMRPLYVLERHGRFYFSSELKAFDAIFPGEREFAPTQLLDHALLWNTIGSDTVWKGIRSVESGCVEIYSADKLLSGHRYYDIGQNYRGEASSLSFDQACDSFAEKLHESVSLRLRSDVPVGGYLSGGIDSTVIAQLVKDQKQDQFRTFSVEFDDPQYDESRYQRMASDAIGSKHEFVRINTDDISDYFLETIYHTERPIFRTAPTPLYHLSKKVRTTDIKVVLTGEGADEILFGYDTFKELKLLQQWRNQGHSDQIDEAIAQLYPHLKHYADPRQFGLMKMYYEGFLDTFDNAFVGLNVRINNNKIIQKYLNKDWGVNLDNTRLYERFQAQLPEGFSSWSLLQKNSYLEIKTLLEGYLLSSQGDRMALGNSVEGRYPFLDHNVIDFVFALPDDYKLEGFSQKHLLKQAFFDKIPEEIVNRPKRPYMAPDIAAFYRGDTLVDMAQELLSPEKIDEYGTFDGKMVQRFLRKFSRGVPEKVGYRDNMIFTFILSSQACSYWAKNPRINKIDLTKCTVNIQDD